MNTREAIELTPKSKELLEADNPTFVELKAADWKLSCEVTQKFDPRVESVLLKDATRIDSVLFNGQLFTESDEYNSVANKKKLL